MKKKLLPAILGAILASILLVSPVFATYIIGVHYDFDAPENEWALWVDWGDNKPDTIVNANEFQLGKKETTVAEVEARIQDKFNTFLVEDVLWNQLDPEEEAYQGILSPGEEIYVNPSTGKQYLRVRKMWFAIHIYSLDNLETPESELSFTTKFITRTAYPGGIPWETVFPDGWWN